MCRSRNTVHVQLEHINWENDAMTVQFAHTKTDMSGDEAGYKRHVYAKPFISEICTCLSLALNLAVNFKTTELQLPLTATGNGIARTSSTLRSSAPDKLDTTL